MAADSVGSSATLTSEFTLSKTRVSFSSGFTVTPNPADVPTVRSAVTVTPTFTLRKLHASFTSTLTMTPDFDGDSGELANGRTAARTGR